MDSTPQQSPMSNQYPQERSFYGKHKWLKWGLIYLAIAAIVYGGIYYFVLSKQGLNPYSVAPTSAPQPPATPTDIEATRSANWKKYQSKYFTLKYPPAWTELRESQVDLLNFHLQKVFPGRENQKYEFNDIAIIVTNRTIEKLYIEELIKVEKREEVNIQGVIGTKLQGLQIANSEVTDWQRQVIYSDKDSKRYLFIFTTSTNNFKEFDRILSTFKFLE